MASANTKGARAPRATTQTIDQIEARAAAIDDAERDGMDRLADFIRELAVELPPESRLPIALARTAKKIDTFNAASSPGTWGCLSVDNMIHEYGRERIEDFVAQLERGLSGS